MLLILPALTRRPSLVTGCHSFSSLLAPRRPRRPPRPRPRSPPREPKPPRPRAASAIIAGIGIDGVVGNGREIGRTGGLEVVVDVALVERLRRSNSLFDVQLSSFARKRDVEHYISPL